MIGGSPVPISGGPYHIHQSPAHISPAPAPSNSSDVMFGCLGAAAFGTDAGSLCPCQPCLALCLATSVLSHRTPLFFDQFTFNLQPQASILGTTHSSCKHGLHVLVLTCKQASVDCYRKLVPAIPDVPRHHRQYGTNMHTMTLEESAPANHCCMFLNPKSVKVCRWEPSYDMHSDMASLLTWH